MIRIVGNELGENCPTVFCSICGEKIHGKEEGEDGWFLWRTDSKEVELVHRECQLRLERQGDRHRPDYGDIDLKHGLIHLLHNYGVRKEEVAELWEAAMDRHGL